VAVDGCCATGHEPRLRANTDTPAEYKRISRGGFPLPVGLIRISLLALLLASVLVLQPDFVIM